ncbi:helix-turn-helix transcriptional regulator [Streptomyces sp. NPDC046759]|uniref:helix-turn-helix domain-containing protein n=1 Tax=Streptomyces sp. NPDC046759 TaxID=3155019 RepID=UPI0033F6A466
MLEQPYFGQRLRALRLSRSLSQAALAGAEMSTGYLSRLESGARPPTTRIVGYLAERLGVPVTAFEPEKGPGLAEVLASVTSQRDEDLDEALTGPLVEALSADEHHDPALRWQALWLLARIHAKQGRYEQEYVLLAELSDLAGVLRIPELRARVYTQRSRCALNLGLAEEAREYAAEAVTAASSLTLSDRAGALLALVSAEAEAGRLAEARAHVVELCELTEPAGASLSTMALWAAATVAIRQGAYPEATKLMDRAVENLDSREDLALWLRLRLASASLQLQIVPPQTASARAALEQIGPALELVGTEVHRQEALLVRAHLACAEGDLEQARALCADAAARDVTLSFRDRIRLRMLDGKLDILAERTDQAVQRMRDLAEQARAAHHVELAAEIWRTLAETLEEWHRSRS